MRVNVKVVPRAKHEKIESINGGLKVYIKQPPVDGKANKYLIKILAKHFDVKQSAVNVIAGVTSRNKIIQIDED
ncbi:MAG: DUF167 domain-containing protein [Candidatus Omnitrophica bacterium]|nr:DUF167 domain-containing protein [Candidatus Omnitrophota bacterium]MDD5080472.1 DUF167 domain-containing protein [Candidatus Omnitrophota bacterium]